jgi:hypothetical protein
VLELAASTVSAHLAELKRAGLVVERKAHSGGPAGACVGARQRRPAGRGGQAARPWPPLDTG